MKYPYKEQKQMYVSRNKQFLETEDLGFTLINADKFN